MGNENEIDSPTARQKADARRQQMIRAALAVFTANGYVGTSTDELAAAASVSKQTLYKAFGDKEGVFAALIHDACDRVDDPFEPLAARMRDIHSADEGVRLLAVQFVGSIMDPRVLRLRRLVIAEATRFPELGSLFWERGFVRVAESVGRCLQILDDRQLLAIPDTTMAVHHFAGMLLWFPSNQAMFAGSAAPMTEAQLERVIDGGTNAFVRAYQPS
jgi:TetR/AcrR family transcriptional regulator, mexJK operon transcriptional repressor